jgi:hypothetical protein
MLPGITQVFFIHGVGGRQSKRLKRHFSNPPSCVFNRGFPQEQLQSIKLHSDLTDGGSYLITCPNIHSCLYHFIFQENIEI